MRDTSKCLYVKWDKHTDLITEMRANGTSWREIVLKFGVSEGTVAQAMKVRKVSVTKGAKPKSKAEIAARKIRQNEHSRISNQKRRKRRQEIMSSVVNEKQSADQITSDLQMPVSVPDFSFSVIRNIDRLIHNKWDLPYAFEEVTGHTYAGSVR